MQDECREYFNFISEFLDEELDESLHKKIKEHLKDCPECQDCINSLKNVINSCRNMPFADMDSDAHKRIMAKLTEELKLK
jgi:RNA polymerase sigma-70 factor (ECF subfamily)